MRVLRTLIPALVLAALAHGAAPASAQQIPAPAPVDSAGLPTARGAFLRSLVLPGWGQAYVGATSRGALYFALEAGSVWMAYSTGRRLADARQTDDLLRDAGVLGLDEDSDLVISREGQREDWVAISIFLLLFSGADAYVAAHLADFDAHVGVRPGPGGGLRIEAAVPLGGGHGP